MPTATPWPTNTPLPPTKYDRSLLLFGPYSEQIAHEPDDRRLEVYRALNAPGDILIEATFVNPYADASLKWEHGFLFKWGRSNHFYSTTLESTQDWEHYARMGSGNTIAFLDAPQPAINVLPGEENLFQVAVVGDVAWAYINGVFAGQFPADLDTGGDRVALLVDDDYEGTTSFRDAAVWRWGPSMYGDFLEVDPSYVPPPTPTPTITPTPNPAIPVFGPEDGIIVHEPNDGYLEKFRGPTLAGDVMVEVTMEVPFAPNESHWNFSIQFDDDRPNTFHLISISSVFGGALNHWRRSGSDSEWQGRLSEDLHGLNLQKGDTNHIRLIVVGDAGHIYVNHRRAGIINFSLGDIPNPDRINLVISDQPTGRYDYSKGPFTEFENFTVWRWHESLFDLPDPDD